MHGLGLAKSRIDRRDDVSGSAESVQIEMFRRTSCWARYDLRNIVREVDEKLIALVLF